MIYAPPRPGIVVGLSIDFAPSIFIGPAFVPFGWSRPGFAGGRTLSSSAELRGAAPGLIALLMFTPMRVPIGQRRARVSRIIMRWRTITRKNIPGRKWYKPLSTVPSRVGKCRRSNPLT